MAHTAHGCWLPGCWLPGCWLPDGTHGTRLLAAGCWLLAARLLAARLLAAGCWLLAARLLADARGGGPSANGHGYGASADNFFADNFLAKIFMI
jgi:hypothetical protein